MIPKKTIAQENVLEDIDKWLRDVVIGMNLCPFAKKPLISEQVRIIVELGTNEELFFESLIRELTCLDKLPASEVETTLIVTPECFDHFEDYLDALDISNNMLADLGWEGVYQIASFHPDYQFEGVDALDRGNYTNRSPYPVFHLIREDSLEKAIAGFPNAESIPQQNIDKMHALSKEELKTAFYWLF